MSRKQINSPSPGQPVALPTTEHGKSAQAPSTEQNNFNIEIPSVSLPRGGGAIKSIDEKFLVNPVNGTAVFSVPIPIRSARGFGPSLTLSYNSGSGNGIFGLGWSLDLPSVRRKTDRQLPQYRSSDGFVFGGEDLVPRLVKEGEDGWNPVIKESADGLFIIHQYRPRIEARFSRIEQWTRKSNGEIHWRIISKENVTSIFGDSPESRVVDPNQSQKVFEWKISFSYDDKGNCASFEYKAEDSAGIDPVLLHNKNRVNGNSNFANSYLKRIRTGNKVPYKTGDPTPAANVFLFETTFDYGEHDQLNPPFTAVQPWPFRDDAFSDYRAGFEIRTCRLCQRVIVYHHIEELPGGSAVVATMDFNYDNNGQPGNFSFLKEITSKGFIKNPDNSYTNKYLPPLSISYQNHEWNKEITSVRPESTVHLPAGILEPQYQLVDLFSEGLNGILIKGPDALYYKHNLGDGNFAPARAVSPAPSLSGAEAGYQLQELEADGTKYLAAYNGLHKGFFKIRDDDEWEPYKVFEQSPPLSLNEPAAKLLDLNGDGKAELLVADDHVFTWYPSLGEKGFDTGHSVWQDLDEEKSPRILWKDQQQSIFLSDMNGDGLIDFVRIKNGEICYWPNLGYGKFGAKVSMDHAPVFDEPEIFNASRIKLADIDGSGTTDILYFGNRQCKIWLNQNGNSFLIQPILIDSLSEITLLSQVTVTDLLGTGTACIVWSSPQPKDQTHPLRYIDLMKGKKPHLITGYSNNQGKEVELHFQPSTYYYRKDKEQGHPWICKLPFPVQCLSKCITHDRIMKTRMATEYSYHHGYYDHAEREFRGFGRVDQKDAETITHFVKESDGVNNNLVQQDLHQPPVLVKTWFHTGVFLDRERIFNQYKEEYTMDLLQPENLLPEPALPPKLTPDECREALRACKGTMLRKEIYALDGTDSESHPYLVEQQNASIQMLQPRRENKFACFLVLSSETITYHYERSSGDPRISHRFILESGPFGNIKKSASLVYKRTAAAYPEQDIPYTIYTENNYTDPIDDPNDFRCPQLFETKIYEVTDLPAATGNYYSLEDMKGHCGNAGHLDYEEQPDGNLKKRLVDWSRLQFYADDAINILSFGAVESKALLQRTYKAALRPAQLGAIFGPKIQPAELDAILTDPLQGGYIFANNHYWVPSVIPQYDKDHFYLPIAFTDPFGHTTHVQHNNKYYLFIEKVRDALQNESVVKKFNYRLLQPYLMQDANDNLSAIRFDELGLVTASFRIGKAGADPGDAFDEGSAESSAGDFPSSVTVYHLMEWYQQSSQAGFDIANYVPQPSYIKTSLAETHYHAHPQHQTLFQESYSYFNGSGQEILKKVQAEPGEALVLNPDGSVSIVNTTPNLRWVGNGRSMLNNKGNPVKQYEAYFSVNPSFDDEKEMVEKGVTQILHYDPLGRVIQTDFPNGTLSKVEFSPWFQKNFDPNDTVEWSPWYDQRILHPVPGVATPEEVSAAQKAALHHNTPDIVHFDTLGRKFLTIGNTGTEEISSHTLFDIEGKEIDVKDGLNRVAIHYEYDMLGRQLKQTSIDAGTRWSIMDAAASPLLAWDDRDHQFRFAYDELRRPLHSIVQTGNAAAVVFNRIEYGESLQPAIAKANNLRLAVHKSYDQSGVSITHQYDFKGNLRSVSRQLAHEYQQSIDWSNVGAVTLDAEQFTSSTEYDALNRPVKSITPHTAAMLPSEIRPGYNATGQLCKVDVRIRNEVNHSPFVLDITYNEKGQRLEIFYANQTKIKYTYDKQTFLLVKLLTTRNNGDMLQDLFYTYDPAGNITQVKDNAQPDKFFDNEIAQALNQYEYDAIYRLIKASGRKHAGQNDIQPKGTLGNNPGFRNHPFINHPVIDPNDSAAFRNYTEHYAYDKAGNMKELHHISTNSGWTRKFEYDNDNNLTNRLTKTTINGDEFPYTYDTHGNMYGLETVSNEVWNFMDQFKQANLGGGGMAYYVYDAGGQRVRKIIERPGGIVQERIYLGGIEIYRERNNAGPAILQRETLHIMDDQRRIALIDIPVIKPPGNNEETLIRYQYDNHLGSACYELDHLAAIISYEEYFPYGSTSFSTIDATREVAAKRYRYTGRERDEETGLNYHSARYYALWLCRWTQCDPAGMVDGPNLYRYCRNNPVNTSDPNGMDPPRRPSVTPLVTDITSVGVSGSVQVHNLFDSDRSVSGNLALSGSLRSSFILDVPQLSLRTTGIADLSGTAAADTNLGVAGVQLRGGVFLGETSDWNLAVRGEGRFRIPIPQSLRIGGLPGSLLGNSPRGEGDVRLSGGVGYGNLSLGTFRGRASLSGGNLEGRVEGETIGDIGRFRLDVRGSVSPEGNLSLESARLRVSADVPLLLSADVSASGVPGSRGGVDVRASGNLRLLGAPLRLEGSGNVSAEGYEFSGTASGAGPAFTSYVTGSYRLSSRTGVSAEATVFGAGYAPRLSLTDPAPPSPGMRVIAGEPSNPWTPGGLVLGVSHYQYSGGNFNYISAGFMPDLSQRLFTNPRFGVSAQWHF